jgi:D-alanine-D-alanine ligase
MRIAFVHNLQRTCAVEQAEFDSPETVAAITAALERLGHEVVGLEASGAASQLTAQLESLRPDLVFNTAEGERGRFREAYFPALYERLGLAWTGSDAEVCAMTLDKALTRRVVAGAGIPVPGGGPVRRLMDLEPLKGLSWPRMVKPNCEGSSKGIDAGSVVHDHDALRRRVIEQLVLFPEGLIVEEYIDGVDVTVPWLQTASPETAGVLEPASYAFDPAFASEAGIYDFELKVHHPEAVTVRVPAALPGPTRARVRELAARAVRALGLRDLARLDFRVGPDGQVWFIEANALPSLEPGASLYEAAALDGLTSIDSVLAAVIASAVERQGISPVARVQRPLRVGVTFNLRRTDAEEEAEHDPPETIAALHAALSALGYDVVELEATPDLPARLAGAAPDLVFNLAEGWAGRHREAQVPGLLELAGIAYTGSDPGCMVVSLDKALAKRVVAAAGVRTPTFAVMRRGDEPLPPDLRFPVFAKPLAEGSSKGIDGGSLVHRREELTAVVGRLVERYRQPALVEEYLPGREFTVGVLEPGPVTLPIMEILPVPGQHRMDAYDRVRKTTGEIACTTQPELSRAERFAIERAALRAFEALGCRDVARIDLRQDRYGEIAFIECNPLPGLTPGFSDLCLCAEAAGLDYQTLVARILAPAVGRLRDARRSVAGGRSPALGSRWSSG